MIMDTTLTKYPHNVQSYIWRLIG